MDFADPGQYFVPIGGGVASAPHSRPASLQRRQAHPHRWPAQPSYQGGNADDGLDGQAGVIVASAFAAYGVIALLNYGAKSTRCQTLPARWSGGSRRADSGLAFLPTLLPILG